MIGNIDKMNGWSIEELPNLVFFQEGPGVRNNQYTDSGVKLLNVANLKDGNVYLDNTDRYISEEEAYGKYSHFLVDEGDLVIASSGIKVEYFDKKMGFAKKEHLPLCMNTSTIRFKTLDDNILDIEYFAYFFKTNYFKKQISRLITGSAQLNFGPSHLKQIKVILPPIETQKKIVEVLDKAQELIDKRKEQIKAMDELVKSRFIEMFGNIITNSYNWKTIKLKDISILKSGGTPTRSKPEYFEGDIPWITTVALGKNLIDENDAIEFITQDAIDNSATKLIPQGSLLFGMRVGVGKISVNSVPMCTNQDIMAITEIDTSKYNLIFMKKIIESYSEYFNNQKRGATIQGIKSDTLKEIKIPIVDRQLQNEFADFVKQVDELKLKMETSLKELEDNFNSLMQKAFKGELFN